MSAGASTTTDREIVITRVFDAPREKVYAAFTDAKAIPHWFGPNGFRTTVQEMDVRPGGTWRMIMHGPDGTDHPNLVVFSEVVPNERLAYHHGSGDDSDPGFDVVVTFADKGGKTELTMSSLFPTAEAKRVVVEQFHAIEGGHQTLERLSQYLAN
jgi:uncharacterized protein YndB with AHSA1/START domain